MKILLPALSLLLGSVLCVARRDRALPQMGPASSDVPEQDHVPVELLVPTLVPPEVEVPQTAAALGGVEKQDPQTESPRSVSKARTPRGYSLVGRLKRELRLSEEQTSRVLQIVAEREKDIEAYEAEIRERGWAKLDDFGFRIGRIRELTYGRIGALLDSGQMMKFDSLRGGLLSTDSLSIAIPEEQVMILD